MICPDCKSEYRQGFTRCADCDVELVEVLPGSLVPLGAASAAAGASDEDPFCEFWKGEDARVRGELCDVLAEESIPYRTIELQEHLFNFMRFPAFRIAVPFSMFERAEKAVVEAYGSAREADSAMHPTEENRPEFQKLVALSWKEKLESPPREELPGFWDHVKWETRPVTEEPEAQQPDEKMGSHS